MSLKVEIGSLGRTANYAIMPKKIRTTTTTAFLISNTVVLNPYSHSTAFNPHFFTPLS